MGSFYRELDMDAKSIEEIIIKAPNSVPRKFQEIENFVNEHLDLVDGDLDLSALFVFLLNLNADFSNPANVEIRNIADLFSIWYKNDSLNANLASEYFIRSHIDPVVYLEFLRVLSAEHSINIQTVD